MHGNNNPPVPPRTTSNVNGSARRVSPCPISSPATMVGMAGRPTSLMDAPVSPYALIVQVEVNRDEKGYGMKVSGDKPVYVQSVKEGGASEKAGLHAGDKILKVNGVNVMESTHTDVVALIRSSPKVVLTVQQRQGVVRSMGSPRPLTTHASHRITGPQPVDDEKQYQLQLEREQQIRLMIEKEQRYIEKLRGEIAASRNDDKTKNLSKAEANLQQLQKILENLVRNQHEHPPSLHTLDASKHSPLSPPKTLPPKTKVKHQVKPYKGTKSLPNSPSLDDAPPPLPKRGSQTAPILAHSPIREHHLIKSDYVNGKVTSPSLRKLTLAEDPPPLPPRNPPLSTSYQEAANSISKQLSYPLVATCTPLHNHYIPPHTHQRTKSSPDSLFSVSPAEASRRLIATESMHDLSRPPDWEAGAATPPGTPPPPYPSPLATHRLFSNRNSGHTDDGEVAFEDSALLESPADRMNISSPGIIGRLLANSSPIHAATSPSTQQPIISMEDDEISDAEAGHLEDGPFKSLSRLWQHTPHLAVFMNYILSNSDPNSLLFYLITDLYKEGNAKEMRKWAFEIHSSFLVPGAVGVDLLTRRISKPIRLSNVDENIAREIDDVLTREFDKEEILRKIFWKARNRAKEELTKQLADFQHKRTTGLGTIYGPTDAILAEISQDKLRETRLYESLLLDKLKPFTDELDRENCDPQRYLIAAALATVITRIFGVRSPGLDRYSTFVNKEKSFRTKFMGGKYARKWNVQGHQFAEQPFYTVILCNNCHQIIYGIAPQGYQCLSCLINLHRWCVKLYEDVCPGPIVKNRGKKFIDMIHKDNRRKHGPHFIQMERERRLAEERDVSVESEIGDGKAGHPVSRSGSDRRPDAVREEASASSTSRVHEGHDHPDNERPDNHHQDSTVSLPAYPGNKKRTSTNINRSESVKEQSEKRKQRRNISDPLRSDANDTVELEQQGLTYHTNSGSSSNSSLSSNRSSESPSTSLDAVTGHPAGSAWDSDFEVEAEPPAWQSSVPEEELARLHPYEKKRQDVVNELFHTERSHVRNLKVLEHIFRQRLEKSRILKSEEIQLIFPNITELLDIHTTFNSSMKSKRREGPIVRELGDLLVNMFDGGMGENFQAAAAAFCERQQLALEFIKERRKKDSRFDNSLCEYEKDNRCRRLPLQGILPTEMQRLSKYPLLLERLIDSIEKAQHRDAEAESELIKLKLAHDRSKEILNHVNEAAKIACNKARLEDMQRHLDVSAFERTDHAIVNEFKNLDLTRYKLIYEGPMHLRRPNKQPVPVHIVLLEEAVILLQRDAERYLLKFFQAGGTPNPQPLAPIIKTSTLLVRANAASKSSLFLVNTSTQNSQMYDLKTRDASERDTWFKHISDAAEAYNRREGKSKRNEPSPYAEEVETVQELPPPAKGATAERSEHAEVATPNGTSTSGKSSRNSDVLEEEDKRSSSQSDGEGTQANEGGGSGLLMKLAADDWPLVQPTEVNIAAPPVHIAEPVLTPIEQIRRKDEEVRKALADKEGLVADLLSIPREDYHLIADMAGEETKNCLERDPAELVLAAVYQADQLLSAVNDSLNISEVDAVIATGGKVAACASNEMNAKQTNHVPSVPVSRLKEIATNLSTQLTTLLSVIKQRDEERDRLRKELQRTREQLHEKLSLHPAINVDMVVMESVQSVDLESIEEGTEHETN